MGLELQDPGVLEGFAPQIVRVIFHNPAAAAGEGFLVDLHWQNVGDEPAQKDYWIFVQFCPEDQTEEPAGGRGFSWEFSPARDTSRWQTGFVVKEEGCFFRIPPDVEPGRYTVLVGLFDREGSGERIPLRNRNRDVGGHRYRIGTVRVTAEPQQPGRVLAYRLVWRVREPAPARSDRPPRFIGHGRLGIGVDPERPVIQSWRLGDEELPLCGDPAGQGVEAEFAALDTNRVRTSLALGAEWMFNCRIGADAAVYRCRLRFRQREVARFELRFKATRTGLEARLGQVREAEGFHLLSVTVPALAGVAEKEPGSALVIPTMGGRLVDIAKSGRHREVHRLSSADPLPCAAVLCDRALAGIWAGSLEDQVVTETLEAGGARYATLGIRFRHRHRADRPELQFAPGTSGAAEVTVTPSAPGARLDWTDAARLFSRNFRSRPGALHVNSFCYRLRLNGGDGGPAAACEEAAGMIQQVAGMTGGHPQIVYLAGWENLLGNSEGRACLEALRQKAAGAGAVVSHQVDLEGTSALEPGLTAVDEHGAPASGGERYRLSPAALVRTGRAAKLVDEVIRRTGLEKAVMLTRMTGEVCRVDHSPERPSGAAENHDARRELLSLLRRAGLEVSGDFLTGPFAGLVSHFHSADFRQEGGPYSAYTPIPLVPFVLHGRVTYASTVDRRYGECLSILYGFTCSEEWTAATPLRHITDRFYLISLPWSRLAARPMLAWRRSDTTQTIIFGEADYIQADLERESYRVVVGGYTIARDCVTTCPLGRRRMAVYSKYGASLRLKLPAGWPDSGNARALLLREDGQHREQNLRIRDGHLEIEAPEGRPIILAARGGGARVNWPQGVAAEEQWRKESASS